MLKRVVLLILILVLPFGGALANDSESTLPNDPLLVDQWYIFPPSHENRSAGSIDAIEAWRHIKTAKPIVVAIFDAGVNYRHPDLEANIWTNEQEKLNGEDDDGNGYVDDLHGWNFVSGNNLPLSRREPRFPDQFDHGTAIASLIAAVPNNGIGISGVGRNVRIMPLRVIGPPDTEDGYHADARKAFPEGIRYAIRNGARVIVCTTSLNPASPITQFIEAPLKEANEAGVLFVRSAGNSGRSIDEDEEYKFLSQFPNVLVVGGTLRDGTMSPQLNFGTRVKIAAPSIDMAFASFDGYAKHKGPGTSFAAPIVAAAAATLLSQLPELTPAQVIARLRDAAIETRAMPSAIDGGRLDMANLFRD